MDTILFQVLNPQRSGCIVHGVSRERGMMNGARNWKRRNNRGAYGVAKVECVKRQPGQDAFDVKN